MTAGTLPPPAAPRPDNQPLREEAVRAIAEGRADHAAGRTFSAAEVRAELEAAPPPEGAGASLPALLPAAPPPDRNPAAVYLRSLGTGTSRRNMLSGLRNVVRLATGGACDDVARFPWADLRYAHVSAIRSLLVESGAAPATCNVKLAAVKGVLRTAWRLGLMTGEDFHRAADVGAVRGSRLPAGRALGMDEIAALFASCADGSPSGARDAALLAVLYGGGLRRAEAAALQAGDVEEADGGLTARVVGKGGRERRIFADNGGGAAIAAWLKIRGGEPGPLLCRVSRHGRVSPGESMTPTAIRLRILERCRRAGIEAASPHDLRRTFVSRMLDAGADVGSVQRLAGHASVDTTLRYDRRDERAARKAAALLHVPYQGGGGLPGTV